MKEIKLGFYTDPHHSGRTPRRRKDNYPETVQRKHKYIYSDGIKRGCDLFMNGGDINESPLMTNTVTNDQIEVFKTRGDIPEFGIYGNHDVIGNNSEKANQFDASILFNVGFLTHLKKDEPTRFELNDITLAIYGVDVHKDMDNLRPEDYYCKKPDWADWCLLVAHGWLTERDLKLEGVAHTTFQDVVNTGTEADIIYTGHYHPGHGTVQKQRLDSPATSVIMFHNPGSPVRMKARKSELTRKVGYSITTFTKSAARIEFIEFPSDIALPGEEVLDRETLEEDIRRASQKENITMKYSDVVLKSTSPKNVIMEIATEKKLSKEGREDLSDRIEKFIKAEELDKLNYEA